MTGLTLETAEAWIDTRDAGGRAALTTALRTLPPKWVVGFAARCARRVAPLILRSKLTDAMERLNAAAAALAVAERWCRGAGVSRFTLEMATRLADAAASREAYATFAVEAAARAAAADPDAAAYVTVGRFEQAAFTGTASSALDAAACALVAADAWADPDAEPPDQQIPGDVRPAVRRDLDTLLRPAAPHTPASDSLFGPLWPDGEPGWWRAGWTSWSAARPRLPIILDLPMTDSTSPPADVFLDLDEGGRAALADENWVDEQYNLGAFDGYRGEYIAVAGKRVLGHDKSLKTLRAAVTAATGLPAARLVTALIVRKPMD